MAELEQGQQSPDVPVPATDEHAEVAPVNENESSDDGESADPSGTSEQVADETDEQKAERQTREAALRRQRAQRNNEAAARRLTDDRDYYRAALDKALQALGRGQQPQPLPQAPPVDDAPKQEDFTDYTEFVAAKAAHLAEKRAFARLNAQVQDAMQNHQRQMARQEAQQIDNGHLQRVQEFAQQAPDFADVTDRDDIRIPDAAAAAIKRLPDGPAVLYTIAKQPEIAQRMQRMSPFEQAVYVGQISSWIRSQSPQISNAAPAGRAVGSKPAAGSTPPDDPEAYMAWANKKFGRR